MNIPNSLQSTWNSVIKDNKITREEYQKLVNAAAPNKQDSEFDKSEIDFLGKVRDSIGDKSSISVPSQFKTQIKTQKPSTSTSATSSSSSQKEMSFEFIGNVGNASSAWAKKHPNKPFPRNQIFYVTKDGNLISQSKINETAKKDPNYFNTLGLKGASTLYIPNLNSKDASNFKLQNNKIVNKSSTQSQTPTPVSNNISFVDENNTTKTNKFNPGNIPSSLKDEWEKVSSDGKINHDDYNSLIKAAAPNIDDSELTDDELTFLTSLKNQFTDGVTELLLDKSTSTAPSTTQNSEVTVQDIPATPQQPKQEVTSSVDAKPTQSDISNTNKVNSPTTSNISEGTTVQNATMTEEEVKDDKPQNAETTVQNSSDTKTNPMPSSSQVTSGLADIGKIPESVKVLWDDLSKDKEITPDDLEKIIKATKPTGKNSDIDSEEVTFITNLIRKMIDGNGTAK